MIVAEKPPLNEDLLIHFGIKGMKWGHRKKRPDEGERKAIFTKQNAKRVAVGAAVIGGAAAAIYIMSKRGKTPISELRKPAGAPSLRNFNPREAFKPSPAFVNATRPSVSSVRQAGVPSPAYLRADLGQRAHAQTMARIGNQRLTDKAWRDSAKLSQLRRQMDETTNSLLKNTSNDLTLANIRRNLEDPNYVWQL